MNLFFFLSDFHSRSPDLPAYEATGGHGDSFTHTLPAQVSSKFCLVLVFSVRETKNGHVVAGMSVIKLNFRRILFLDIL
jgi:hypothetical protein